jgi:Asp-tRNA(Asn)/Glu-tRNA(Gln) amidotransferase A subunit family amidase
VSDIDMPQILIDAWEAHGTVQDYEAYRALAYEYDNHRDELGPLLRGLLDAAAGIDADTYDAARRITKRARQALGDLMNGADVILTPSAPGAAPESLASTGPHTFNRLWTLMGTPCVNVPGLRDDAGLPLGVQIVGRFGQDRGALEAARFVELALARTNV